MWNGMMLSVKDTYLYNNRGNFTYMHTEGIYGNLWYKQEVEGESIYLTFATSIKGDFYNHNYFIWLISTSS